MHDIRSAPAPLDDKQAWAGGGPHFERHEPLRITLGMGSYGSPGNDYLQIGELVEASVDRVLDVAEGHLDDGPKRQREQF